MNRRPLPLYYTFGNHMHWVDMQWLWGYSVLPGSVSDMLELCKQAGVRGNVNFEGIGYEKMAAECPESLAALREAVAQGIVEPVGCSYGQPYGLFQGGESNIRQFTYGVRATRRLLGARPATFWEEEFYFYPQLVQVLRGCGYTGASLFFQWTWHTPEIPKERASLIEWEGVDGSRIPTLPRNDLNVHQWPEDFDGLLEQGLIRELENPPPAIVQWLELMPSKDWMCRSEVLLPRLKALVKDERFDVRVRTAGQLIDDLKRDAEKGRVAVPVRRYGPDDVWHGMTLGKNADAHPRASASAERAIMAAEAISTTASYMGRPYASWDVYPTWELDEAWRDTLAAQHHDNHECEGLCGFVGHEQFVRAKRTAEEAGGRALWLLAHRAGAKTTDVVNNPLGWARRVVQRDFAESGAQSRTIDLPPFGYRVAKEWKSTPRRTSVTESDSTIRLSRGQFSVEIEADTGVVVSMKLAGRELLTPPPPPPTSPSPPPHSAGLFHFTARLGGKALRFDRPEVEVVDDDSGVRVSHRFGPKGQLDLWLGLADDLDALDAHVSWSEDTDLPDFGPRPDAGMNAGLQAAFRPGWKAMALHADAPYSMQEVRGSGLCKRKYPKGDWMTSPQWFEDLHDPFNALTAVDLVGPESVGLLIAHDGSQQWFRDEGGQGVRALLTSYDPWDELRYTGDGLRGCAFRIIPHTGPLTNAERIRHAAEFRIKETEMLDDLAVPVGGGTAEPGTPPAVPQAFGMVEVCGAPGVLAHALFRESEKSGEHLPDWAGHEMARRSGGGGACTHPTVVRLVEWNGEPAEVTLKLAGPVAAVAKTTMMGEIGPGYEGTEWLTVDETSPPAWAKGAMVGGKFVEWCQVRIKMRPREIATIMADIVPARKQWRDLDAKRKVWATIHKV